MFRLSPVGMESRSLSASALFAAALASSLAAATPAAAADITVEDPWIREAPPGAAALAGYMILGNGSDQPIHLVGAHSEAFDHVMIHRTEESDGVARMVHQHQVTVPAGERVEFRPGGLHLMLMHPKEDPRAGDQVEIELHFSDERTVEVTFPVRGRD